MIKKILIANRGEIAIRIIRTCKEMGIKTVAVYSEVDKNALHVQLANESICIGGNQAKDSYLNMANILSAACLTGCDAVHPGFGFLSENSKFARLVEQCGMIFIGPSPEIIDKMGNKSEAREMMIKAKVPVVPGSEGTIDTVEEGLEVVKKIGCPVLIKACGGGGGKGMKIVRNIEEFESSFLLAKSEASSYFADDSVYIEKLIESPKHVEVQIMGDKFGNILHLFERDCSMQRKHQKVVEEAPCYFINDEVRKNLIKDALKAAKAAKYNSVGTIEFILDSNMNYYFIEMNTRIQVEHTVTEMLTDLDLIYHQIKIADNQELKLTQQDIKARGHVIECRINAENIRKNFMPSCGKIDFMHLPGGKGIRIDSGVYTGLEISPYYDSMILKLIVFAPTRLQCIRKMRAALEELIIDGIETNVELHYMLMHQPAFVNGTYDTGFIEKFLKGVEERGELV